MDGYRERLASTTESLRSQVQLARIWVETVEDGESTHPAALVGLEETERDAGAAADQFERYEPPAALVSLRSEFGSLAAETTDALAALRIAAQQERWEQLGGLAEPLPALADSLEELEERAEP